MSRRYEVLLWTTQRLTAAILAACVIVHLATIIYAVRGGLSAADVLARTRGSTAWAAFYGVFVLAAAMHGAIGLRTIAAEWLGLRGRIAEIVAIAIALLLAITGVRAIVAVVAS